RTTRHCWCMSFCTGRLAFAAGWVGGGNRRRFETMTAAGTPLGVLALVADQPAGWAACGPRSRYLGASPSRHALLGQRPRVEDSTAWLVPCLFVHPDRRGHGVSHALLRAATSLARHEGAVALEGWPLSGAEAAAADAYVGREQLFLALGFHRVAQPVPGRAIVRLDLPHPHPRPQEPIHG
ncbi:MAG: GCN5-related N-acetyltransferase, partial [Friedmanniella sp.]|nr:GCN5-related N-acetyltransferase [Friedmanniella sp.]